jgi:hypothetical protein
MLGIMHFVPYGGFRRAWALLASRTSSRPTLTTPLVYPEGVLASPWCLHLGAQNGDQPDPLNQNEMGKSQRT